ncbi:MAG: hypothetical protein FJY77_01595 [Candidatus Altiarchaeales archaeon]|nr:hypothetical protein [Candidatus Altiarchaeales archaeon]
MRKKAGQKRRPESKKLDEKAAVDHRIERVERVVNLITLVVVIWFLLSYFNPRLLLLKTNTAGGDTCAHNYLASYMRDYLLPHGKFFGWSPGWWAGFPMFQYYFFMPYLMMALLSYLIPLEIAFKIVSVLGIFTLPVFTLLSLKYMRLRFPIPAVGAILSLLFLFHERQTVWGLNIASMLAGEISVSLSFAAMVLYLGTIYKSVEEGKFRMINPLLFSFVIFTHLTTTLVAGFGSLFLLITKSRKKFVERFAILFKTYAIAFLLTAFWTLSLASKLEYSVGFGEDWNINVWKLYPTEAWVAMAFAAYGLFVAFRRWEKPVLYMFYTAVCSIILFYFAFDLNMANIRFWAFHYYYLFMLAAYGVVILLENLVSIVNLFFKKARLRFLFTTRIIDAILPLVVAVLVVLYLNKAVTFTASWIVGNYEGYESKMAWNTYKDILNILKGTPGRVANDLSDKNVPLSSSRAFEALPYFIGKPMTEGGIVQSGLSSLFTYYIQCETSTHCAGFPRIMTPTRFNLTRGTEHMKLYNIKYFIAVEDMVKNAFSKNQEWRLVGKTGQHEVYELTTNKGNYVYVPEYNPVLTEDKDWKFLAMRWFSDTQNLETPIAITKNIRKEDKRYFKSIYPDSRVIWSTLMGKQPEYVGEWLLCGVFPNERYVPWTPENSWNSSLDYGLDIRYMDEENAKPAEGVECGNGKRWSKYYSSAGGFVDMYTAYEPNAEGVIAYAATYVYSPEDRTINFWYGSDDGVKIWLNNRLVHVNHIHRGTIGVTDKVELNLSKGWNLVVIKIENVVSGWGFYAKLLDLEGNSMPDVVPRVSPDVKPEVVNLKSEKVDNNCQITESMKEEVIEFNTTCPGKPHIVKVSYFPNWKAEGAEKVYLVTPAFMLVYPEGSNVRLYYGSTTVDYIGLALTYLGLLTVVLHFIRRKKNAKQQKD